MAKPKVFSLFRSLNYEVLFPKIKTLSRPYNIFLQCSSYDVILPITKQKEQVLNIFEQAVLKLINYKSCSVNEIADELCMSKDLINFIVIRLREMGLIDDRNSISKKGKELINLYKQNTNEIKYLPGKIFVIKGINEVLPYIHTGEFLCEDVIEYYGGSMKVANGTAGTSSTYSGRYLRKKTEETPFRPMQAEIRKLVRSYNKICSAGQRFAKINIDNEYAIDISRSEDVALHLQAIVQEGNVDSIIISDGFVLNVDILTSYISKEYPDVIDQIKRGATEQLLDDQHSYNTYNQREKYPELKVLLRERIIDTGNQDQKMDAFEKNKARLTDCFSALEWSLHYYLKVNPLSNELLTTFKNQTPNENKSTIADCLKKLRVKNIQENAKLISNLDKGKINYYFQTNQPSLYTVLPLVIAEATYNGESNIHNLIREMPDFLAFINELNTKSQWLRHTVEAGNENDDFDEIYNKTVRFVELVISDFVLTDTKELSIQKIRTSQQRINAQVSLSDAFGSVFFSTIDSKIQNDLIKISLDKRLHELPLPYEFVLILSRVLESYLYQVLKYIKVNSSIDKTGAIVKAEKRIGFMLPKSFTGVGEKFYERVLYGGKATLGAYSIVLLAFTDDIVIEKLTNIGFTKTIDEISGLRKHGNSVGLCVDYEKLSFLRNSVIQIIKTIGGYYG